MVNISSFFQKSKDIYEEKIRDQQQYIADLRTGMHKEIKVWNSCAKCFIQ